jgi:hypothetical protein
MHADAALPHVDDMVGGIVGNVAVTIGEALRLA